MHDWIQRQISSGFAAFTGLAISGTVPINEDLINEILADILETGGVDNRSEQLAGLPNGTTNVKALVKLIRKARVHASDGIVTVDFEIRV